MLRIRATPFGVALSIYHIKLSSSLIPGSGSCGSGKTADTKDNYDSAHKNYRNLKDGLLILLGNLSAYKLTLLAAVLTVLIYGCCVGIGIGLEVVVYYFALGSITYVTGLGSLAGCLCPLVAESLALCSVTGGTGLSVGAVCVLPGVTESLALLGLTGGTGLCGGTGCSLPVVSGCIAEGCATGGTYSVLGTCSLVAGMAESLTLGVVTAVALAVCGADTGCLYHIVLESGKLSITVGVIATRAGLVSIPATLGTGRSLSGMIL